MPLPQQRVIPTLRITDHEGSKAHQVEKLGFTVDWEHRFEADFPVFMSVVREGMQVDLTQQSGDCQVGGLVHFVIQDVDAWHKEFRDSEARVTEAPNDDLGFRLVYGWQRWVCSCGVVLKPRPNNSMEPMRSPRRR